MNYFGWLYVMTITISIVGLAVASCGRPLPQHWRRTPRRTVLRICAATRSLACRYKLRVRTHLPSLERILLTISWTKW